MSLDWYRTVQEASNPLVLFIETPKVDREGVLFLADVVVSIGTDCAFAIAGGRKESIMLAAKAVEGVATNALFVHGVEEKIGEMFFHSTGIQPS